MVVVAGSVCIEEWNKKEKFFLKLQSDYLEGELSKEPKPQNKAEETNLTQVLLELGEDTVVNSTPVVQATSIPQTSSQPSKAKQKPPLPKANKKKLGAKSRQPRQPSPARDLQHQQKEPTNLPQRPTHQQTHSGRSASPLNRQDQWQQRPLTYNWYHERYQPQPYHSGPEYCQWNTNPQWQPEPQWQWNQTSPHFNQGLAEPTTSNGQQDFLTRLVLKNLLR